MFSRDSSPGISSVGVYTAMNLTLFNFHKSSSRIVMNTNTSRDVRSTVMQLIVDRLCFMDVIS